MIKHKQNILAAIVCVALSIFTAKSGTADTLRSLAQQLHCSNSSEEALAHIHSISNLQLLKPGLPNESADNTKPLLKAETLNQLLSVLHASTITYPDNKDSIEAILLRWNFCSVIDRDTYFDHWMIDGVTLRAESKGSANNWQGFKLFGLVPGTINETFRFTTHHRDNVTTLLADSHLLQSHIRQCLPHPDDSRLFRAETRNFISRVIPLDSTTNVATEGNWTAECKAVNVAAEQPTVTTPLAIAAIEQTLAAEQAHLATLELESKAKAEPEPQPTPKLTLAAAKSIKVEPAYQAPQPVESPIASQQQSASKSGSTDALPKRGMVVSLEPDNANLPTAPTIINSAQSGNALASANVVKSYGLSGAISLENRSFDPELTSIKISASYKPMVDSYWFIRSSGNISTDNKPFTYSWGLGYDDWHSGTWAFQINHWGPLKFGDGFDTGNATMSLSHKIHNDWIAKKKIGSSIGLSKTFSKEPVLSWGWSWSPHSRFFVRSTINLPLESRDMNWSYGFGYTRYSKSTVSFEYNNWGLNTLSELNFKQKGQLSLVYRWEL